MSTTEALLGNFTEMLLFPNINESHSFDKKTYQPGEDYVVRHSRHFVTRGACNEFSGAILKRQTTAIAKCYKLFVTI